MIADLHTHTHYSFDSKATMEDYITNALAKGVDVLCFTDHVECGDICSTFDTFQFAKRAEQFHNLKAKYSSQLKLLLGVEFGEPHLYPKQLQYVHGLGLDMIIGSIHYPYDKQVAEGDTNRRRYERIYAEWLIDMVKHGGFDVVGHMDMPKKYNNDYQQQTELLQEAMRICVANHLVPELNTSSIRQKNLPPMPDINMIQYYRDQGGVYVTVNSDSHVATDVGADAQQVISQLPQGVKRCYFENRQLVELY